MSVESVRQFLFIHAPDVEILELPQSTATVELAANGHGVAPAQIAKTLSLRIKDRTVLVVTCGTARLNNRKVKDVLGGKASMLSAKEVAALTGHPVGGVCPFGLTTPLPIYCDVSLRAFDEVLPAAGSTNSALRINPTRLAELVRAEWVDVCDVPGEMPARPGLEPGGASS
jgi:prolyl-tRNA editing enzyme YbaK/EbsC (Cys-tRNA(Pro) deacylase)